MKWLLAFAATVFLGTGCHSKAVTGPPDLLPPPTGTVRLTVTVSGSTIGGIDHLAITVGIGGAKTTIRVVSAGTIPPNQTLDLKVLMAGTATIAVEARDASERVLGQGDGTVQTVIDQSVDLTVNLQPV